MSLALGQEYQTHFHRGPHQPNVILGLYKCNYALTRGKEFYIRPFEGNRKADVAPGENEFDTPALGHLLVPKLHDSTSYMMVNW